MAAKKTLKEDKQASDDLQSSIPEPVVTGNPHANRGADQGGGDMAPKTLDRVAWMNGLLNIIQNASAEQLEAMYGSAQSYINGGQNAAAGAQVATNPNMATLRPGGTTGLPQMPMPTLSESLVAGELKTLLEDTGLDEDFQDKAALIFEVAVGERVAVKVAEIQDAADQRINEETEELKVSLNETVDEMLKGLDAYTTMVAQTWLNENKLAVDTGVKAQLGENIIKGIRDLVESHNINFKEEDVSVVKTLEARLEEGAARYNEIANTVVDLKEQVNSFKKEKLIAEANGDLTLTERERLVKLCENVDFTDEASFKKKLKVLTETYIRPTATPTTSKPKTSLGKSQHERLDEDVTPVATPKKDDKTATPVSRYVDAARRYGSKNQ
jgi:hypothetical protein